MLRVAVSCCACCAASAVVCECSGCCVLLLLQVLVNTDASLAKQEKLTGRWMQMEHLCAFSLVFLDHARTQELARAKPKLRASASTH